ncbi:hypothetical protein EMIHUDRAFT_423670 [Emiliania huxleyi CCMP1516]|uniref:LIM zinc-binding domain-containing protein n=4 Tax=Emiliania huxleyi TaxID=2903 RepID=A0A0D3KC35_EMIH1|nr:hypothetical protein EMIHUDRAFT_423670 [Emiliania huxleyi CCMP1516]EOD33320.1 hypothetical protein EMIHUDRAFT_423670 [Emiliania huxleyi CCMP1516]|eukprot:XP_005785749.1 hypothetical protein EMIHUDRAFT_423670 [Emiliania huxleyi CCMP1516]
MPSQSELFASEWHYSNGPDSFGPATLSTMRDLFATGQIDAEAFVWNSTMKEGADWLHLGDPANKSLLALLKGEANEARERDTPIHGGDSDVCAGCGQRVGGGDGREAFGALGKLWHVGCFKCAGCERAISADSFIPHEGKAYHPQCHLEAFGTRCAGCQRPIDGPCLVVEGKKYHAACFTCAECGCSLKGGYAIAPISGKPFCAAHIKEAKKREAGRAAPAFELAVEDAVAKEMAAARIGGASGGGDAPTKYGGLDRGDRDRPTIDYKTGEELWIETGTNRKYRLAADGGKEYIGVAEKPRLGGARTWNQAAPGA